MKKLLSILFILFSTNCVIAQENPISLFNKANALYEKENYNEAIKMYESLVEQKQTNPALCYNLGNAYYRTQKLGLAIVNYERALRLSPRDPEIQYNLNFLRNIVKEPPFSFGESVINWFNNLLSLNELTILCSLLYFLLIIGLSVYIFKRFQWLVLVNSLLLSIVILFSSWLILEINYEVVSKWAIVIAGPVEVRNGPGQNSSVAFNLPEGRKVVILGEKDNWYAIGVKSEGLKGWLEKNYIEKI